MSKSSSDDERRGAPYRVSAYVDFKSSLPLHEVARRISVTCCGGIPFGGEGTGIWDEVPAMLLEKEFLGFDVVVGGEEGFLTLEVSNYAVDLGDVPDELMARCFYRLDENFRQLLSCIDGIELE